MSIKLWDVDPNFKMESTLNLQGLLYHDIKQKPFRIYGADKETFEKEGFWRISETLAKECSLEWGANCTAGFRVRFQTNSEYVAIKIKFVNPVETEYRSNTRMACDLYTDYENGSRFVKRFIPPGDVDDRYEGVVHLGSNKNRYFTLNLLSYEMVKEVYIGLEKEATIDAGKEYLNIKPIVYYGSSITQGGTCHRPGNTYQSIICRRNNIDYKNLGFSGRGKAEIPVMEYISSLDMSVFVYDALNATDIDFLQSVHERGYKIVRKNNPDLPIIIVSWPEIVANEGEDMKRFRVKRRVVEMQTYINAVNNGDENVYFIDGKQFFNVPDGDCCTADGCHPTDYGFVRMADIIGNEIDTILQLK